MKVRVTLMTENDKHMPMKTNEEQTAVCLLGWRIVCKILEVMSDERATVESVEVIEN